MNILEGVNPWFLVCCVLVVWWIAVVIVLLVWWRIKRKS